MNEGCRIEVRGTVQGVGFRPWVYRLARRAGIAGRVRNNPEGVTIEAFGGTTSLESFLQSLQGDTPASARIVELRFSKIPSETAEDFVIERSEGTGARALSIPPDLATCAKCEDEVLDAHDRRYRYPFTNCTECGPRFTITTDIPYDRSATTMHEFTLCPSCEREFHDVVDRRFHAQPNACPECGPRLSLWASDGTKMTLDDPLGTAVGLLRGGAILAIKGLGGFHLACDASNALAVQKLRARKHRDEKPFAVMARDLAAARLLSNLTAEEESLLSSQERPIVLAERRPDAPLAAEVAPESPILGLFLPYTPLHHLLLREVDRPLVMTSANIAGEPICKDNTEAVARLGGIADVLLVHDRDIAMRCDDSVARVIAGKATVMRRSRGFVPRPFQLKESVDRPVLACGAHLKNTFCIAVEDTAYFGPHIGDLETLAAMEFFEEAVDRVQTILSVEPEVVAHDLHPGYLSTRYAKARGGADTIGVQHHHAHVVSAMAEHGLRGPVLGIAYDGTGYGNDGTAWGGEILLCFTGHFQRLATFRPIKLPGGNRAMREVWRVALSLLHDAFSGDPPLDDFPLFQTIPDESIRVVTQMIDRDLNAPQAHGVGRYFDGLGALVLGRPESTFEGQLAVAWNVIANVTERAWYPFEIDRTGELEIIDLRPMVRAVVEDVMGGVAASTISAKFHNTLIRATGAVVRGLAAVIGQPPVVLTGGVFQNPILTEGVLVELQNEFKCFTHSQVPPGDGGLALGQVLVANAIAAEGANQCA
ncbi:MAG: carbamoyltransferase HypF [Myxococcales bacterium]|nr:carbamoyltransferase HypF [Myxococcales bacterium]